MDHFHIEDGAMLAEDVPLADIANAVGTPVFVYSTATIERHTRVFAQAVAGLGDTLIAYAVKANPNGAVLATLARMGIGADVVSGGEIARSLAAGIPADKIIFSGVGKIEAEMALALKAGVGQFNLESEPEAETLSGVASELGMAARIAFRINPDVDAGTHAKISTGKSENKFGIPYDRALDAYALADRLPGLDICGVAVHIGSQLTDLTPLENAFARIGALIEELRATGYRIATADLGGGLGVLYDPKQPDPPSPAAYGAMVASATQGWDTKLIFEPGRVITGNAGILLTRVVRVKSGATQLFVIVDAAMNDLLRPSLYDAWHDVRAVVPGSEKMTATVVGPVCETGDTFARGREIDRVEEGDLLIFATAGAYAAAMANSYNSRPLTPEVIVAGGDWHLVRERPAVTALIEAESLPPWLTKE